MLCSHVHKPASCCGEGGDRGVNMPALGDACSFVRTHICASVAIRSKQLKAFIPEALHVLQLEVADAHIQWHRGHVRSGEVYRARGEVVLAQPLLRQVIEATLHRKHCPVLFGTSCRPSHPSSVATRQYCAVALTAKYMQYWTAMAIYGHRRVFDSRQSTKAACNWGGRH